MTLQEHEDAIFRHLDDISQDYPTGEAYAAIWRIKDELAGVETMLSETMEDQEGN